jgi:hypothetical protein
MKKTILAIGILTAMSACAQRPDAIAPVPMGNAFATMPCQTAANELNMERQNLAALSAAQNSAASSDAVGVFLIGIPWSSLSGGDKAGMVGASKGKVIALEQRLSTCY